MKYIYINKLIFKLEECIKLIHTIKTELNISNLEFAEKIARHEIILMDDYFSDKDFLKQSSFSLSDNHFEEYIDFL